MKIKFARAGEDVRFANYVRRLCWQVGCEAEERHSVLPKENVKINIYPQMVIAVIFYERPVLLFARLFFTDQST